MVTHSANALILAAAISRAGDANPYHSWFASPEDRGRWARPSPTRRDYEEALVEEPWISGGRLQEASH